jgi:hypothetical protein
MTPRFLISSREHHNEKGEDMKRLILLLACLVLAGGQNFYLAAYANCPDVPSFDISKSIAAATGAASMGDANPLARKAPRTAHPDNYVNLEKGNVLLSPETDICVGTHEAKIYIADGATVFLMVSAQGIVIYDLYQSRPKLVSIVVDNYKLIMQPGRMLVVTTQDTQNFQNLAVNCRYIDYCRTQKVDLHNDAISVFVADFSMLSALTKIRPLKQLAASDDKRDKLVLERILKSVLAQQ